MLVFWLLKLEESISRRWVLTTDKLYWSVFLYHSSKLSWEEVCYPQLSMDRDIQSHQSKTRNPGEDILFAAHIQLTDRHIFVFIINKPFLSSLAADKLKWPLPSFSLLKHREKSLNKWKVLTSAFLFPFEPQ